MASAGLRDDDGCIHATSRKALKTRRLQKQTTSMHAIPSRRSNGVVLVLQRHVGQLSMAQVIVFQELKSFLRISIRTWLMDQNPCETSHFLAIGVLTQR